MSCTGACSVALIVYCQCVPASHKGPQHQANPVTTSGHALCRRSLVCTGRHVVQAVEAARLQLHVGHADGFCLGVQEYTVPISHVVQVKVPCSPAGQVRGDT